MGGARGDKGSLRDARVVLVDPSALPAECLEPVALLEELSA